MSASQSWPVADLPGPQDAKAPETAGPKPVVRPPRPWLVPVVVGTVAGIGLAAWWVAIANASSCFIPAQALGFGLVVLLGLGALATCGVGLAFASERPGLRRIGKALMSGALAAVTLFLVLTSIVPVVVGACVD